jgi:hypothetical protein
MSELALNAQVDRKDGEIVAHPCAVDIIYEGALVKHNAAGFLAPCAAEVGALFAGVAVEKMDNSAGSAGDKKARVYKKGRFLLTGSSFAQADVGLPVYATDDQTITKTNAADKQRVGIIDEYVSSTKAWVCIDTAVEQALYSAHIPDASVDAASAIATVNLVLVALRKAKIISEA